MLFRDRPMPAARSSSAPHAIAARLPAAALPGCISMRVEIVRRPTSAGFIRLPAAPASFERERRASFIFSGAPPAAPLLRAQPKMIAAAAAGARYFDGAAAFWHRLRCKCNDYRQASITRFAARYAFTSGFTGAATKLRFQADERRAVLRAALFTRGRSTCALRAEAGAGHLRPALPDIFCRAGQARPLHEAQIGARLVDAIERRFAQRDFFLYAMLIASLLSAIITSFFGSKPRRPRHDARSRRAEMPWHFAQLTR